MIDASNPITKNLLYIYTMESPIYQKLNSACRNHDESQIMILGPYAMALKTILGKIERYSRKDDPERLGKGKKITILYRGLKLT